MTDLSPKDVIAWFRAQAKKYNDMADVIERDFGSSTKGGMPNGTVISVAPTPDRVRRIMGEKRMRQASIANQLGVDTETLDDVLTEGNGFIRGERGWVSRTDIEYESGGSSG